MKKTFAVVGEDARQQAAGEYLARCGYAVVDAAEVFSADYILLPMPLDAGRVGLAHILRAAKPGAVAFGGRISAEVRCAAEGAGIFLEDYFCREELAVLNAVPTAEGCIALLLQNRKRTLWHSRVLVAGYGRIGAAVAARLLALGAKPTVAARRAGARAAAMAAGCETVALSELSAAAPGFDAAVNTIPAMIFTEKVLRAFPPGTLLIDLASQPGGTDFAAAQAAGVRAVHALSLPARCAPVTAGELVARTVLAMLNEREGEPS